VKDSRASPGACLSLSLLLLCAPRGPLPPRHPTRPGALATPHPYPAPRLPTRSTSTSANPQRAKQRSGSEKGDASEILLRPGETPQSPLVRVRQTCVVFAERGAGANPPPSSWREELSEGIILNPGLTFVVHLVMQRRAAGPTAFCTRRHGFLERAAPRPRPCPGSNSHISRVTGHKTETWNIEQLFASSPAYTLMPTAQPFN